MSSLKKIVESHGLQRNQMKHFYKKLATQVQSKMQIANAKQTFSRDIETSYEN